MEIDAILNLLSLITWFVNYSVENATKCIVLIGYSGFTDTELA